MLKTCELLSRTHTKKVISDIKITLTTILNYLHMWTTVGRTLEFPVVEQHPSEHAMQTPKKTHQQQSVTEESHFFSTPLRCSSD
mgnify:CR=1 FL=1